jgi:hypothetical protein
VLIGACRSAWVAAEMMVRSTARFRCVVLADPLGGKFGGREERDTPTYTQMPRDEFVDL